MRTLLAVILVLSASSAWALTDSAIEFCFTTAQPKQCLVEIQREVAANQAAPSGPHWDQQAQLQRDLARQQAAGMAAFGSGNALVNGMNQGLRQMQVRSLLSRRAMMPSSSPSAHNSTSWAVS